MARAQAGAYPDLRTHRMDAAPADAFKRALQAARGMGWEIVAADAAAGRIEATDTTFWFGFKDDAVIRVEADGAGSRVDVRSVDAGDEVDVVGRARLSVQGAREGSADGLPDPEPPEDVRDVERRIGSARRSSVLTRVPAERADHRLTVEPHRGEAQRNLARGGVREALADLDNPHARAFCAAYLAWDRLRQSDPEGAKELRELARRLDPECVPLLRAEQTG